MGTYFNQRLRNKPTAEVKGPAFPPKPVSLLHSEGEIERREFNARPRTEEEPKPKPPAKPVIEPHLDLSKKRRYYDRTGAEVWAVPEIHLRIHRGKDGTVVSSGPEDVNLDKWTLEPPETPEIPCPKGCARGSHKTQRQVDECVGVIIPGASSKPAEIRAKENAEIEEKMRKARNRALGRTTRK